MNRKDEKMRAAIIGCGRIAKNHVEAIAANRDKLRLEAVCDPIEERAREIARQYEAAGFPKPEVFADYRKALLEGKADMASICTESGTHARISIDCMRMGKHVIVEKPMALSTPDADEMIAAAEENGVKLCVCHQNRFNPPVLKLREALEEGRFGRLIAGSAKILWNRNQGYYAQAPWRGTYQQDGGCLMNQCIHDIDLLQWMLGGEMSWLHGETENYLHPYIEGEDYGSIQIKFKNGAVGNVEGTVCVYPHNLQETLTILGETGTVVIGGLAVNKIMVWDFKDKKDDLETVSQDHDSDVKNVYGNGHAPLYRNMLDAVETGGEPLVNGREGKKSVEIVLGAYRSSFDGARVSFPLEKIASTDFRRK